MRLLMFVLFLSCVSMASVLNDSIPEVPTIFRVDGYQKQVEIRVGGNTETNLAGYNIYRWKDTSYIVIGGFNKYQLNLFQDTDVMLDSTYKYVAAAYNYNSVESPKTAPISVTIHNLTDNELLDMVQRATFRYFWDFAHPTSGLTREGSQHAQDIVTIGGSGFGVMTIPVGIERGFITRDEGTTRLLKILNFLSTADRFHGVFPHWMNGATGKVIPFSTYDNGGDLVETAYLIQGLLTCRKYFNQSTAIEDSIRSKISSLWESVEWDWYRRYTTGNTLYWHWSPNYGWQMNMPIVGYNEAMIVYLLAISSPTHSVPASMFANGWASSGYVNGHTYYGVPLFVGPAYGGPLFFYHYSFLGFDPRYKKDSYTNYFANGKNASLIHRNYCISNPFGYPGYNEYNWGLTASDGPNGYSEHRPASSNDNGTISPTAAISSIVYTPEFSLQSIRSWYQNYFSTLWGPYGFKDAFNIKNNWFSSMYLAIDQGPEVIMIENYRSQLLWNNFMANSEIQNMLTALGFQADPGNDVKEIGSKNLSFKLIGNYPNPFNPSTKITFTCDRRESTQFSIYNVLGKKVFSNSVITNIGVNEIEWNSGDYASGIYIFQISQAGRSLTGKMILQK